MADRVYYVYGIVPAAVRLDAAPAGVDGSEVAAIVDGNVAALTGALGADEYEPNVNDRVTDVAWLAPRARAHDAVLTWASDAGPVVPLPILSLFRSEQAVRSMLAERREELNGLLERLGRGREYGVRIFRLDDELRPLLGMFSSTVAALEMEVVGAASPGQGYLLSRKLDSARKDELQRVAATVAAEAFRELASLSMDATQEPLAGTNTGTGTAILNASFLVAHDRVDDFREAVTRFVRDHHRRGFRMEFTGPWPAYHFTRGVDADAR
jgi:hypothetical protein